MPNASLQTLTRKPPSSSTEQQHADIALQVLSEAFSTLRIRVLKPEAISEIRAEVKRRVVLQWQRAA